MSFDLFEMLAEKDVTPVPADFDRLVHERVNHSLIGVHVLEFVFQAIPYALVHFVQGVIGLVGLTLSGGFPRDRNEL